MSVARCIVVTSVAWRTGSVDRTSASKPWSEKMDDAIALSDWSGQALTFSSRSMSTVASIATTSICERPGSALSAARTSIT